MTKMFSNHWNSHARQWQHIGPPLRPCAEDIRHLRDALQRHLVQANPGQPVKGLLLGVTPEIATGVCDLPVRLWGADRCLAMIAGVWPGNSPLRQAVCADWLRLPFPTETFDFAVGDGCLTTLPYPDGYAQLAASVTRCLKPGGIFLIRLFCRPAVTEPLEAVFADLRGGRIGNFHVFKWRLAMALQGDDVQRGVRLADIWEAYHARVADAALLAQQTGWPLAEIMTIEAYRGAASTYSYPAADEVMDKLSPYFSQTGLWTGGYELAERCPTLTLRRR